MSVQAGPLPVQQPLFAQHQSPTQTIGAAYQHQTPYQQQIPFAQHPLYQQGFIGQQTPFGPQGHLGQQAQLGQQTQLGQMVQAHIGHVPQALIGQAGAPVVSEVTLRLVSTALATMLEQVRTDPQALQTLCTQGQLTPQAYSNVLVESARRSAPIVATALTTIASGIGIGATGMGQTIGHFGQSPYWAAAISPVAAGGWQTI